MFKKKILSTLLISAITAGSVSFAFAAESNTGNGGQSDVTLSVEDVGGGSGSENPPKPPSGDEDNTGSGGSSGSSNGNSGGGSSSGGSSSSSHNRSHKITISKPSHGSVELSKNSATKNTTVTITAEPDDGYELTELVVSDSKGNTLKIKDKGNDHYTFTMPDSAVTIKTIFDEKRENHDITIAQSDHGVVTAFPITAKEEQLITLTANPDSGYTLKKILLENGKGKDIELKDKGNGKFTFVMPDSDVVVTPVFEEISKVHRINVVEQENGTITLSDEAAEKGETITISVMPHTGYQTSDIIVNDEKGNRIDVNKTADGKYELVMPDTNVLITVIFTKNVESDNSNPAGNDAVNSGNSTGNANTSNNTAPTDTTSSSTGMDSSSIDVGSSDTNTDGSGIDIGNSTDTGNNNSCTENNSICTGNCSLDGSNGNMNCNCSSSGTASSGASSSETNYAYSASSASENEKPSNAGSNINAGQSTTTNRKPQITIQSGSFWGASNKPSSISQKPDTGGIKADGTAEVPRADIPGVRVISVYVPLELPVKIAGDGSVIVPEDAAIQSNVTKGDIEVEEVNVRLASDWKIVNNDKELKGKQIGLSLRGDGLNRYGKLKLTDKNWTVKPIQKLPLNMKVNLPKNSRINENQLVTIEFVFDWGNQ